MYCHKYVCMYVKKHIDNEKRHEIDLHASSTEFVELGVGSTNSLKGPKYEFVRCLETVKSHRANDDDMIDQHYT